MRPRKRQSFADTQLKAIVYISLLAIWLPVLAAEDPYAPLEHHTFIHDGILREYFVHAPGGHDGELPVVFAIHGYLSTATGFAAYHDLRAHADENDYIVVFPQGSHFVSDSDQGPQRITSWNLPGDALPDPAAGPQCSKDAVRYPCPPECGECGRCGWSSCYDDLGYFEKLLADVESTYRTDPDRYYAMGVSVGGMMALRLACSLHDRVAAIASVIGQLPAGYNCGPDAQLPMLHLYSAKDNAVRPDGKPSGDGFIYTSAAATARTWAEALRCERGPESWTSRASRLAGLECTAYRACAVSGQEVVSCVSPDGTHHWPGKRPGGAYPTCVTSQQAQTLPEQRRCEPRNDYGPHRGMDLIWAFFRRYERPADAEASATQGR
jgi:polyhydroxybutyrate depolymerase